MDNLSHTDMRNGLEIAVIGMAGRFPGALNIEEFWDNLKNGVESITFFSDVELEESGIDSELIRNPDYVKAKGFLEDVEYFDARFFDYTAAEASTMDPQLRVFHECSWEALEDAGYDPYRCDELIGLYAGAGFNPYWVARHLPRMNSLSRQFEISSLNAREYLTTRVSYKLNLKGPAVTVLTACSTSLVAIHLACQGILSGECDMALAGGISILFPSINLPRRYGNIYQEGMVLSPDGHCRAFAAGAKGTNGADGIGIVVLKSLDAAIADRDHIYAMVKGSAINNDGNSKVGYTAPSAEAQAAVIGAALSAAGVEADTIGYIETHGTGTALGDPIEIEGLKMVFDADREQPCPIGSVKTNFGHLDTAAGAAGFIKTALALKHGLIPPSLHFETSNPDIGFENSPFYVNTTLSQWRNGNGRHPLRAGVSSFGIGGTNAHVILEEAPKETRELAPLSAKETLRQFQLILLSAKTETALERMEKNLGEYLEKNPGINMADVAYTLQKGRSTFSHRRMLVCSNNNEAVGALLNPNLGKIRRHFTKLEDRPIIFMFPGLGSQYVNMGLELYQTEPVFRQEMDRCFEVLKSITDYNIKEILYPASRHYRSNGYNRSNRSYKTYKSHINLIEIAQPVVFIFEYALAQLLMKWGIKPHAMIGYSFGEYTAACISGVFSLEDALKVIVARGQLIRGIPHGAMLSVPLKEEKLKPLLTGELSIAIDNGASCVISGPSQAVDAFEKQMKEKRYLCVPLESSHAIHSLMMDPILENFEEAVARITLNNPQIPYISNVTGKWIAVEDAESPRYWANHLRRTVRFAIGLEELIKKENAALVEVGPGVALSTMTVQHIDKKSDQLVLNLLRSEDQNVSDVEYLLRKVGRLWLYGKKIDWSAFYSGEKRCRIPLPAYSFDKLPQSVDAPQLKSMVDGQMSEQDFLKMSETLSLPMNKETTTREFEGEAGYEGPRNKVEQVMVEILEELFGTKPIGIHDNFFDLGGDSLKGITFINQLKDLFGEIIHITVIFDAPTVAELSDYFKQHYPEAFARAMGKVEEITHETGQIETRVTEEKIQQLRGLLPALEPLGKIETPKNPPAIFILSPPRTGSTLFRVILAGHPGLFAPPELNLLAHTTLKGRKAANTGQGASTLQGTLRAIIQIKGCSVEAAQEIMERYEEQGMTVKQFYHQLQQWIGDRILVDKSPAYSINLEILKRAEIYFQDARYIFLLRHPYGMIRSYMEARLDLQMGRQMREKLPYSRRELAELGWTIGVQNILEFLKEVPGERQLCIKFEDLVANPGVVMKGICQFLNLDFHPEILQPYKEKKQRMTDGVYSEGIMLGDVKFHRHQGIDPKVADTWKEHYTVDFLGEPTLKIAKSFGYKSIRELQKENTTDFIRRGDRGEAHRLLAQLDQLSEEEVNNLLNERLTQKGVSGQTPPEKTQ